MKLLKKFIFQLTGNRVAQKALEFNVLASLYLMGIGSGSGVFDSGEGAAFGLLRKRRKSPYVIFDVGANKGQFLSLVRRQMGDEAYQVHCFEPGKQTFQMLMESVGQDGRVVANNFAIGESERTAMLYAPSAGSGLASLVKRELPNSGLDFSDAQESVQVRSLKNYCVEHAIDQIHLLKIDVEGMELDVLRGIEDFISHQKVDMVAFEFGGCNIDSRTYFKDFWLFFQRAGMQIYRVTPSGYLFPVVRCRELYEQFRTTNFIAVRP